MWPQTVLQIAISCPIIFSWILSTVWNTFPFKGGFNYGKSQKLLGAKSGLYGGWVTWVIWCFTKKTLYETWCMSGHVVVMKLSITSCPQVAFQIIQILSVEQWLSLMQNLMQIHCSTCSVILNVRATWYPCSLNGVYYPSWIVQGSHHCSRMSILVHSPWLPRYINVTPTILVILTMAGLFLDRPRIRISGTKN